MNTADSTHRIHRIRQTDRQTDRQRQTQTDRQTDRQMATSRSNNTAKQEKLLQVHVHQNIAATAGAQLH